MLINVDKYGLVYIRFFLTKVNNIFGQTILFSKSKIS